MIAFLLLCQIVAGINLVARQHRSFDFLGFKIGMPAATALKLMGKNSEALQSVPLRDGERVLSDEIAVGSCNLPMQRWLGFDSSGKLSAVGLTYRSTPEKIQTARSCAYQWLTKCYGPPTEEAVRDSTKQEVWKLDGQEQITFETRAYNPRDVFVLIYYYIVPPTRLPE